MKTIPQMIIGQKTQGLALIMVLGLVLFLSVIALAFSNSQRISSQISSNTLAIARAQALADGAVYRMVFELSRPRSAIAEIAMEQWRADGVPHDFEDNSIQVSVWARNEAAKIDLNFAPEPLLKAVFVSAGVEETAANGIVAAIKDWIDADDFKRPNGAEMADYRSADQKVFPSNELFIAIEELQNVLGVTSQIYKTVAPLLTVNARSPGIDLMSAPIEVLRIIPDIDPALLGLLEEWVALRDQALRDGLAVPPLPFNSPYFSGVQSNTMRIRADARTAEGLKASREASIRIGRRWGEGNPQFFLWQKGLPTKDMNTSSEERDNG